MLFAGRTTPGTCGWISTYSRLGYGAEAGPVSGAATCSLVTDQAFSRGLACPYVPTFCARFARVSRFLRNQAQRHASVCLPLCVFRACAAFQNAARQVWSNRLLFSGWISDYESRARRSRQDWYDFAEGLLLPKAPAHLSA